jgi:glycosyltransferase involved in cell wall biosynthesis
MRVAIVAPPWFEVPPRNYGGIERICHSLAEGLVARGHEVTVFGAGPAHTSATFIALFSKPLVGLGTPEQPLQDARYGARLTRALERLAVDIVHDHSLIGPIVGLQQVQRPTVLTAHGPATGVVGEYYRDVALPLVAISKSQRRAAPDLPWIATVPNGIEVKAFPFRPEKEARVVFLGRMSPEKGAHIALDVCRRAGVPLHLAGKCTEPNEIAYFDSDIAPRLGQDAHWVGELSTVPRNELLASAQCLLVPTQWDEPFGMATVEALACGTPVVTLDRGAASELVHHGRTGWVCQDEAELAEAVAGAVALDPFACRDDAQRRFDTSRMVAGYERVYYERVFGEVQRAAFEREMQ